jgi:hypothetical protein
MLNKIINAPYTLAATLSLIQLVHRFITGNIATVLGLILPLTIITFYSYFTNRVFTKKFKYLTILAQFIIGLGIEEILFGGFSRALKSFGEAHPAAAIITITFTVLVGCAINYLYLTYGNKLGLWIVKKTK